MDEKLKATIQKIQLLAKQNSEFEREMRNLFGEKIDNSAINDDIHAIRAALEIRAMPSITYDFVNVQRIKHQLIIDNLRMENAALNLQLEEQDRLIVFCVNAFYQLENLLNFYYHTTISNIDDILTEIEFFTSNDKDERNGKDYSFKRKTGDNKEKYITDIGMYHKINAFCNKFFPNKNLKRSLNDIRKVRNKSEHRSDKSEEKEINSNEYFNINTIRSYLKQIVETVKNNIGNYTSWRTATITSKLPSACFIQISDKTFQLPNNFLEIVNDKKTNEEIFVLISNGIIIQVNKL